MVILHDISCFIRLSEYPKWATKLILAQQSDFELIYVPPVPTSSREYDVTEGYIRVFGGFEISSRAPGSENNFCDCHILKYH